MTEVQTPETQAGATPHGVLAWLKEGNQRFVARSGEQRDLVEQARLSADGQYPLAAILGCIDSRVPIELVFDVGIGDVFAARVAGNVAGPDITGSLEFAAELAGVKLIVVLGHSACGAVKGACDGATLGSLTGLLARITPAVEEMAEGDEPPGSDDPAFVERVVEANVRNSVAELRASPVLRAREASGELAIVGAVYDLATGTIEWLAEAGS